MALLLTPMQLGHTLQSARKAKKLTQADIAGRLGLSQKRISALEHEPAGITVGQLLKWSAALDLELTIGTRGSAQAPAPAGIGTEW